MKRKILSLFLYSMMLIGSVCGCNSKTDKPSSSSEVVSTVDESSEAAENKADESFEYNGTFNEEVFRHIIQDINLNDIKVSMPRTFADLGEGFAVKYPLVFKEKSMVTYSLEYNDIKVAQILYYADHELTDKELNELEIPYISISRELFINDNLSVAGINTDSDYTIIDDILGEPTEMDFDGNEGCYDYSLSEKNYVSFFIIDKKISSIDISVE